MSFKFLIPGRPQDLLTSGGNGYFVSRVSAPGEIPSQIKDIRTEFRQSNNLLIIFDHFDVFFSVIEASDCPINVAIKSFDFLYECIDKLRRNLALILNKPPISDSTRSDLSNASKMFVYLFVNTIKVIDLKYSRSIDEKSATNNRKKNDLGDFHQWDTKRKDALDLLFNIAQLPLECLYDPPVIEEDFVNLICETSYRTLQMPSVKDKRITETAFQILGIALKRFNHALMFPVRLLQILADKEYCITPIANATYNILYQEYGITTIFDVLIKELAERLIEDATDHKISKHFSQFLMDLGSAAPALMIPHLSDLAEELLNHEPYVLRNSLLQIMGDIIIKELSGEGLADELKVTRDEFLDFLFDHIHDSNAHVRSKVLHIWNNLKSEDAVPLSRIHKILERAVGRLEDKSSLVRKSATILIKSFLEHNPYSSKLSLEELQQKYEEEEAKLRELQKKRSDLLPELEEFENDWEDRKTEIQTVILNNIQTELSEEPTEPLTNIGPKVGEMLKNKQYKEALELVRKQDQVNEEEISEFTFEQKCQYYLQLLQSYYFSTHRPNDYSDEIAKTDDIVKFFHDFIAYTNLLTSSVPKLEEMLMSKTNSDVFEAIDFFTTAYRFGIKNCVSGMHRMIYLVWSDKEKREAVTDAYKKVLFITDKKDRAHAFQVVENLTRFLENLNQGHYSAFEELMKEWIEAETIDPSIIQVMFERYTMKLPDTSENDSRLALQLLVLSSSANPNIVSRNMEFLVQMGIEERGLSDPRIYAATLDLLVNSVEKKYEHPSKYYKRYGHSSEIIMKIIQTFKQMFFINNDIDFDTICIKTFNFIYRLCNAPDALSQTVVFELFERMKQMSVNLESRGIPLEVPDVRMSQIPTSQTTITLNVPSIILSRFIYMVGFVAMKEMIYLDIDVYSNLKYREELRNEQKKKGKHHKLMNNKNKQTNNRKTMTLDMSASNALKRMSIANSNQESLEEEDLIGATAEDAIAEQINYICEAEMLYSNDSLVHKFTPLILTLCKLLNRHKDEKLQQSVVLALIHLMSISSRFCEENIPFLMNIFKHSKNVRVKCNIIIGLSDFTFRFPNVIAPWTSYLYATLQDDNIELRLTGVKMLSHLILHEMIRVKGQISNLAMCLVDPVIEIKIMTEQFFKEIANKSNILYNVLPDIISRLSDNENQVEEHKYQSIMRYIIALINKDKQVESLVEKLCLRFKITTNDRQWRDIAFCLSLLTYNEKTIKKLIEHIPCYKDKVQVNEVYDSFKVIVTNTMKLIKPELKVLVQEFDSKLEECLSVQDNLLGQENGNTDPSTSDQNNQQNGVPKKNRPKTQRRQQQQDKRPVRNRWKKLNQTSSSSSSSESEDSDFENQNPKQKKNAVATPNRGKNGRGTAQKKVGKRLEPTDSSGLNNNMRPRRTRKLSESN